ncbi:hypothetical protein BGZ68_006446 [Mortierella alpina]|nr:hypothetical protein BGZ68_006446 [Mortierella alpina]
MGASTGTQGNNSSTLGGRTSSYNRGRRDSFQHSPLSFSPTLSHNSVSLSSQMSSLGGAGAGMASGGNGSLYPHHARMAQFWSPSTAGAVTDPNNSTRMRCLSTSSVDSNASSVGFSHLTPAMAAMTVQHAHQQHQASPTNSAYESYGTSPQHSGFQHYYHTQQQQPPHQSSSSSSAYPYHSPFSSPLQQSQMSAPAYDSLSVAATSIATSLYGTTPPAYSSSASDLMYQSPSYYGQVPSAVPGTQTYNSTAARYGSGSSVIALAPSLYSDQDSSTRISQQQQQSFDTHSPLSANGPEGARPFDYGDQYQPQGSYYGQQQPQQQQGLGILVAGGMARGMSSSPEAGVAQDDCDLQQQQSQQLEDQYSNNGLGGEESSLLGPMRRLKRNNSAGGLMQTPDDIQPILGKDGKTLVYLCPKCTSTTKEFTTKSNLKRHLENKNIHKRDQKRWQGHEKKQVCRAETTQRMRTWRSKNPEKNRFNDMRCRVYKLARAKFGDYYSQAKEDFVVAEIDRRKKMMLMRNSRRAEWANQAGTSTTGTGSVGPTSASPSASPVSAAAALGCAATAGFQLPNTDFTFSTNFGCGPPSPTSSSSLMVAQQMSGFENMDTCSSAQDTALHDDGLKDHHQNGTASSDDRFYSDLAQGKLPPRRRSRSAMQPPMANEIQSGNGSPAGIPSGVASSSFASFTTGSFQGGDDSATRLFASPFGYPASSVQQQQQQSMAARRLKKQRSATENPDMFRQSSVYATSPAGMGPYSGVYSGMVGGTGAVSAAGGGHGTPFQGNYMDSNQQLQMLQQKYYPETMSESLLMSKSQQQQQQQRHQQQQQQQQQQPDSQSIESVVEGMEISQAMDLVSSTAANSTSDASVGGLYSDRDASAWLTPSATYNHGHSGSANASHHNAVADENSSVPSGFPFPMVRDRKELARAAGIRLDIPTSRQQQQQQQLWLQSMTSQNANNSTTTATMGEGARTGSDEMVGGSATSHDSPVTGGDAHSTSQSPVLLAASSSAASSSTSSASSVLPAQMDSCADGENMTMKSISEEGYHLSNSNSNTSTSVSNNNNGNNSIYGKSKGSNLEVFPTPTTTASATSAATAAAAAAAAADAGFFTVGVSAATDYLAKEVPVVRRHSTHLSNLAA